MLVADDQENQKVDINKKTNDRLLVWLFGSMEQTVREQVETLVTVSEVWTALEKQFAGKSNKMQATRVMHELIHLKQDSKSVTEYVGEMSKLYRDLHYYHPFEPADKRDLGIHYKWFEPFVSKIFLDGLDKKFDLRRRQLIFSKTDWPSLEDIVSSVMEEETRLINEKEDTQKGADASAVISSHLFQASCKGVNANKNRFFCDFCKHKGHTKKRCYKLRGFPPGWQKARSQQEGALGGKWKQANHTTAMGEVPMVDVQALEEFKSKLKLSEGSSSSQGATNHMTGDSRLFTSYKSCSGAGDRETTWDWDRA